MKSILSSKYLSVIITVILFIIAFAIPSVIYPGFFSMQVFFNLFIDNAFLIVTAIGVTFVIITGGIDLSVGSMIAFTSMVIASLLEKGVSPVIVIPFALLLGTLAGLIMGFLIEYFKIQPFIATLSGMFFLRGSCFLISIQSISINDPFFKTLSQTRISFPGGAYISISVVIAMIMMGIAIYLAHYTRYGRVLYAIGGNEESAKLMGLPVGRTKIMVYGFSGFCSSLGGVLFTIYMLSGYGLHTNGLEMDAIASAVIGGTLLSGGSGYVFGTLFGVLIQGLIQVIIMFQGTLSSWWTKIFVGILLFVFIVLQRLITAQREEQKASSKRLETGKQTAAV